MYIIIKEHVSTIQGVYIGNFKKIVNANTEKYLITFL